MDKKLTEELKEKLERNKKSIEKQLEKIADKDKKLEGDWDTRFPSSNGRDTGSAALEQAADEVEEYSTLLPIEHSLESRLKNINLALAKIEKDKYGICEKCGQEIPIQRLKVFPEAKTCTTCQKRFTG